MADFSLSPVRTHRNTFVHPTPVATESAEFSAGRRAYMRNGRLSDCASDAMARGWLHQEAVCADAYYAHMMAEASDSIEADYEFIRRHC